MKKHLNRLLAIVLVLMLLSADVCAIAEAAVLTLPSDLQIIEEEAFYGDTSISKIIVPDGTTEIRSRAFANSSLTELVLPDSLTFIAEDALDGCGEVTITVPKNCYAYERCVALNLIPDTSFRAQIACSAVESSVGESVTWTGTALYGTAPHKYLFKLYQGEELLEIRAYSEIATYTYTFTKAGDYHVELSIRDDNREVASVRSTIVTVGLEELVISELSCNQETVCVAETPTWTVIATGGQAPYTYAFTLLKDGTTIAEQAYSANAAFSYEFVTEGNYTLKATVKDSLGTESAAYELPVSVAPQSVTIISVTADKVIVDIGETITWTATAVGGIKPLRYAFDVYLDGEEVDGSAFSTDNTFSFTPEMSGFYSVKALVRDANNTTKTLTSNEVVALEGKSSPISDFTFNALDAEYCEIISYTGTDAVIVLPEANGEGRVVQSIATSAFKNNKTIRRVVIPDCVKTIGSDAFSGCTNLSSVNYPLGWTTVEGDYYDGYFVDYYSPFRDCSKLTNIVVPEGVTQIPDYAFVHMTSLTSISLPSTLTEIGFSTFSGCTGLTSISLPEGLKTIDRYAFLDCTGLKSISLSEGLETIGSDAFYGCTNLSSVYCPLGWTTVEGFYSDGEHCYHSPFSNCPKLTSIVVPEGVTVIPDYAFDGVTSLTSIKLPSTLTEIGSFSNCTGLKIISLPEGLETIGSAAFSGCTGLRNISLPDGVKTIGSNAFSGCTGLTAIYIGPNVTSIGNNAFYNHNSKLTIYGEAGSYAETYAKNKNIPFIAGKPQ